MKAKAKPKTPKWYESVKQQLCAKCVHRLRGVVDKPGRYCKYMVDVLRVRRSFSCTQYKTMSVETADRKLRASRAIISRMNW